ncbi:MAG: glycosyltransferase [Lachnospiraceae bacterium]|jgi:glycosyltransferase involved in cell wall biosynthesis|nr:glycosyltransferase [Lachnospiraceae bacterium]
MKISVITVCLNSEATIEQTIKSVMKQKDEEVEYIIIDGGSTDRTRMILDKYKDGIDVMVSEPDQGIYDAMNKGISLAKGEIIGIINSDDWYESDALKNVRQCFYRSDADVVYGKLNLINENGEEKLMIPTDINKLRFEMEVPHATAFIRKDIYEKCGLFSLEYRIAADYELMLRFYTSGVSFVFIDEVLANFRLGGISNRQSELCACETMRISQKYLPCYPPEERDYVEHVMDMKWGPFCFRKLLDEYPDCILDYVKQRQTEETKTELAIFGAGQWGRDMYRILWGGGLRIPFWVDNNKQLWRQAREGTEISSPEVLRSFNGVVLIMARGFSTELLSQIKEMNNQETVCVTWEEMVNDLKDHVFSG